MKTVALYNLGCKVNSYEIQPHLLIFVGMPDVQDGGALQGLVPLRAALPPAKSSGKKDMALWHLMKEPISIS